MRRTSGDPFQTINPMSSEQEPPTQEQEPAEGEITKDEFFRRVAVIADDMIGAYGREFAMGALILAARFIAEGKSFNRDEAPPNPSADP